MAETKLKVTQAIQNTAKARVSLGTDQTLGTSSYDKVNLDTEAYDVGSNFDTTNKRFTAPVSGYYSINACAYFYSATTIGDKYELTIRKNASGTDLSRVVYYYTKTNTGVTATLSDVLYLTAADYIELFALSVTASTHIYNVPELTYMSVHLLSV